MRDHCSRNPKVILLTPLLIVLVFIISCGGSAAPAAPAAAAPAAPAAAAPAAPAAAAPAAPAAAAPAVKSAAVETTSPKVNPGKVILMAGSFGAERFDYTWGSTPADPGRSRHAYLVENDVEGPSLTIIPGIATAWEFSDDLKSVTFTVREGVLFNDGTEVEVEDVLWTLQHHIGPQAPDYAHGSLSLRYGREMENIELGPGPNQVTVNSKKPIPEFVSYGAGGTAGSSLTRVMPKRDSFNDEAAALAYDKNPVTPSAIKLVSHSLGEKMVFERFDDHYFQPANGFHEDRRLQFRTMEFVLAPDESTRIAAIRGGEADMGRVGLAARGQIEAGGGRLIFSPEGRAFQVQTWGCHLPEIPCHDKQVRQALAYALDINQMQNELYGGPEVMQALGHWLVTPSTIGYTEDLAPYPFDPAKARELLTAAGYKNPDNPGGKDFGKLIVDTYLSPYIPLLVESAQLAGEYWETELGIEVEVRQQDKAGLSKAKVADPRAFDGHMMWGGNDTRPDAAGITKLYYLNRDPDAGYFQHADSQIWDLGDEAMALIGRPEAESVFNSYYKMLQDEAYYIGVGYINIPWGVGPRIATWEPYPLSMPASGFHTITLND